jgi:glycosyltransferase 2 family protein
MLCQAAMSDVATLTSTNCEPSTSPIGLGRAKLASGGAAFLLLTLAIFWYQFGRIQPGDAAPRWDHLRWGYLGLILVCLPIETLAAGLRTWVVYRTLEPSVRMWTCIKAEWVNVALNTLTPSHIGGGPAQVYIFSREGVGIGRAFTASLLSFVGTVFGLLCLGLYSLLVPATKVMRPLFEATVWTLVAMSAAMALAAAWPAGFRGALSTLSRSFSRIGLVRRPLQDWWPPEEARTDPPQARVGRLSGRLLDLIYAYRADVVRFLRSGKRSLVLVGLLGLVFLMARALVAYLCIRFLGIEASSLHHIVEIQMALIFLIFFAPTPGGAGLAEVASLALMAQIVPVGFAPYYNLLWRLSTVYIATLAGLFVLASALLEDARALIHHRR